MKKVYIFVLTLIFLYFLYAYIDSIPENNETADIVFTADKNYKEPLKVTLVSAIENKKPESKYNINIICVDLTEEEAQEYHKFEKNNVSVKTVPVTIEQLGALGNYKAASTHVNRSDLFKFFLPEIFSQYDKLLYLDADIIILDDLMELYNTNIKNKYLAAVMRINRESRTYIAAKTAVLVFFKPEFNCGVMLMNLKKMREDKISEKLIKAKNEDKKRKYVTQGAFNEVIKGSRLKILPPKYNFLQRWIYRVNYIDYFNKFYKVKYNDIAELYKEAVILHYSGAEKPWKFEKMTPLRDVWFRYALKTELEPEFKEQLIENYKALEIRGGE